MFCVENFLLWIDINGHTRHYGTHMHKPREMLNSTELNTIFFEFIQLKYTIPSLWLKLIYSHLHQLALYSYPCHNEDSTACRMKQFTDENSHILCYITCNIFGLPQNLYKLMTAVSYSISVSRFPFPITSSPFILTFSLTLFSFIIKISWPAVCALRPSLFRKLPINWQFYKMHWFVIATAKLQLFVPIFVSLKATLKHQFPRKTFRLFYKVIKLVNFLSVWDQYFYSSVIGARKELSPFLVGLFLSCYLAVSLQKPFNEKNTEKVVKAFRFKSTWWY